MGLDIYHVKLSQKSAETIEYFTLDDFQDFPQFIEKHNHMITTIEIENGNVIQGIYWKVLGYQRKQVKAEFKDALENGKLYFDIDVVKNVKEFLKANSDDQQSSLESEFQRNFIDNFKEGESIFFYSA